MKRSALFADVPIGRGTYYILNLVNHRIYIGLSWHLRQRFKAHYSTLKSGRHHNVALQQDWNSFGAQSFEFGVLVEDTYTKNDQYRTFEDMFIHIYRSDDPVYGYNLHHFDPAYYQKIGIAKYWERKRKSIQAMEPTVFI